MYFRHVPGVYILALLNPNSPDISDISAGAVHLPASFCINTFASFLISKNSSLISSNRCWESIDDTRWWIIKAPILVTILVSQSASLAAQRVQRTHVAYDRLLLSP